MNHDLFVKMNADFVHMSSYWMKPNVTLARRPINNHITTNQNTQTNTPSNQPPSECKWIINNNMMSLMHLLSL